ncbi:MAG: hypothetical protein E7643_01195 [Ruminococcaceae bacterium]|nr:hypothetical protein [Oscillospiraceae bacterium]
MKVTVIQPPYSYEGADVQKNFDVLLSLLDACDETSDLIVLPEYSDIPADVKDNGEMFRTVDRLGPILLDHAARTAKRCRALLFVNAMHKTETGYRNTTYAFDREGTLLGRYYKAHPAPSEVKTEVEGGHGLDVAYSYERRPPYVLEVEGLRIGFLTCYDFYFYENFPQLAREKLDIIIGASLQRTDSHEALSIINRFLCYHTNAYLIRASVSLGKDSPLCGCSCVIAPTGRELVNMKSRMGLESCEIDPHVKFFKPAGFGGVPKAHWEYIEEGRRPWLYRNGGAAIVPFDRVMPYPRLCSHRGFSAAMPENTLPALACAVSLGTQEVEFDIRLTADGIPVCLHDPCLDRVSNGKGNLGEYTYRELLELDFGAWHDSRYKGLPIATLEDVLEKLAGHTVMNIHAKIWEGTDASLKMEELIALVKRYDCAGHVYFASNSAEACRRLKEAAPDIGYCLIWNGEESGKELVDRAIAAGAHKVQFDRDHVCAEDIARAHANGIRANLFYADSVKDAEHYFSMGIDTVLTNELLLLKNGLKNATLTT